MRWVVIWVIFLSGFMPLSPLQKRSHNLEIHKVTANTYVHKTYLVTRTFGRVDCNGLVYVNGGEAIVFDTPINDTLSYELMEWIENTMRAKIKAVVVNHFHEDCLGGLGAFHAKKIPSYSSRLTQQFAKADTVNKPVVPQHGFEGEEWITVGKGRVLNKYFGEGHTRDNIVSYIPEEQVLFGGCMIKEVDAKKGNLADANTKAWSNTVRKIKKEFPDVQHVIPGHGKFGNASLLDYTIKLFNEG